MRVNWYMNITRDASGTGVSGVTHVIPCQALRAYITTTDVKSTWDWHDYIYLQIRLRFIRLELYEYARSQQSDKKHYANVQLFVMLKCTPLWSATSPRHRHSFQKSTSRILTVFEFWMRWFTFMVYLNASCWGKHRQRFHYLQWAGFEQTTSATGLTTSFHIQVFPWLIA